MADDIKYFRHTTEDIDEAIDIISEVYTREETDEKFSIITEEITAIKNRLTALETQSEEADISR